jgi:hypothetical protein
VFELEIFKKVDWTWREDYMASSVAGFNSDGFFILCKHLNENVHSVPSRAYCNYYAPMVW